MVVVVDDFDSGFVDVFGFFFPILCCGCQSKVVVVTGGGGGGCGCGCGCG